MNEKEAHAHQCATNYFAHAKCDCGAALSQPASLGVEEVMKLVGQMSSKYSTSSGLREWDAIEKAVAAIVQERDALRARVAELEQDAARYRFRHPNYHNKDGYKYDYVKIKFGGWWQPVEPVLWPTDAEIDAAIAAATEPKP